MSKLLSLEEEPPSLAQAERPLVRKSTLNLRDLNGHGAPVQLARAARARFVVSPASNEFRKRYFPGVKAAEWNDWRWQNRNRIRSLEQLERMLAVTDEERAAITRHEGPLPIGVTPYYMSLIDPANASQGLRRTTIPTLAEFDRTPGEEQDPLGEDAHSPVPGLVHRYPDRVLLLVTNFCSVYCRYCTRARLVGASGERALRKADIDRAIEYIAATPTVSDCLISGGDPLSLDEDRLEYVLSRLRSIPHLEFIRIGSKQPVVQPMRVTPTLTKMLRRYHPLWMSLHFTHPDEVTPEVAEACGRLADAGIPLGSQTVLLEGRQRRRRDAEEAIPRAAEDSRPSLLSVSVRPDQRLEPFPYDRRQGSRADRPAARLHDRLRGAELRRRRPRRRRQDRAAAGLDHRPRRQRPAPAQLRRRAMPVPGSRRYPRQAVIQAHHART